MLPLIGHAPLRARLAASMAKGALPASLLLQGPQGTGKERLALWLANLLLCEAPRDGEPCGKCQHCSYAAAGAHPDLHWYFPVQRPKDSDPDTDDVIADFADAVAERIEAKGPWPAPAANAGIFIATIKALVKRAALAPAIAKRKVIVVGDAEKLVPQEGTEGGANAFLKLLEEPSPATTIILTSSVPSFLLPTIRSRVASLRVPPLTPEARRELATLGVTHDGDDDAAHNSATAMLNAASSRDASAIYKQAMYQSVSGARGAFTETLEALTALLHERARASVVNGHDAAARGAARGVELVEDAKRVAYQNVNPQLITARLLRDLAPLVS